MRTFLLLPALLLGFLPGCYAPPRQLGSWEADESRVELASRSVRDLFLVPVHCEGQGPFWFLLDSGASTTVLDLDLSMRLNKGPEADAEAFRLRELRLGPWRLRQHAALAHDLSALETGLGTEIDGILGYEALRGILLEVDYGTRSLQLSPRPAGPAKEGLRDGPGLQPDRKGAGPSDDEADPSEGARARRPYLVLPVGGERFTFLVDTGAERGLTLTAPELLPWEVPLRPVGGVRTLRGSYERELGRLGCDLELGGLRFVRPIAGRADSVSTIGAGLLRHFVLGLDAEAGSVELRPLDRRPVLAPSLRGFGCMWIDRGGVAEIVATYEGGAARRAGLRPEDRILALEGQPWARGNSLPSRGTLRLLCDREGRRLVVELHEAVLIP